MWTIRKCGDLFIGTGWEQLTSMYCFLGHRLGNWMKLESRGYGCTHKLACSSGEWLRFHFLSGPSWEVRGPLSSLCLCYEMEESVDHVLFYCPRMIWIWKLSELPHGVSSTEHPVQFFLNSLRLNLIFEDAKVLDISIAYIAYHIWLSWNSKIFDLRRFSVCFVPEHALI